MDKPKRCPFCGDLDKLAAAHEQDNQWRREAGFGDLLQEARAEILLRTWEKGEPKTTASTSHFNRTGKGYALNFCPVCGRELKGGRT